MGDHTWWYVDFEDGSERRTNVVNGTIQHRFPGETAWRPGWHEPEPMKPPQEEQAVDREVKPQTFAGVSVAPIPKPEPVTMPLDARQMAQVRALLLERIGHGERAFYEFGDIPDAVFALSGEMLVKVRLTTKPAPGIALRLTPEGEKALEEIYRMADRRT